MDLFVEEDVPAVRAPFDRSFGRVIPGPIGKLSLFRLIAAVDTMNRCAVPQADDV
jgi:hypothetical protein